MMRTLAVLATLAVVATPAHAKVVASAKMEQGAYVHLHDDVGPTCVGKSKRAEHVAVDGKVTGGCWLPGSRAVFVVFFDGEYAELPYGILSEPVGS